MIYKTLTLIFSSRVSSSYHDKILQTGGLKQQKFTSHSLEAGSGGSGASQFTPGESCPPGWHLAFLSACGGGAGRDREGEVFGVSPCKDMNLIIRAPP